MKLIVHKCQSQIFLAVFSFVSIDSQEILHHCVHGRDDFYINGWEVTDGNLKWAASADDLPELFRENLHGQYKDAFYFDLSDPSTSNPLIDLWFQPLQSKGPAYIYIKYYAHAPYFSKFALFPSTVGDDYHYLNGSTDFNWRGELIEIVPIGIVEIGVVTSPVPENFFFIDTIIFVRGKKFSEQEVKNLCPQKDPATTRILL